MEKLKQLEKCVEGVQKRVDALQSELWFRKYGVAGCSLLEYFRTHSHLKKGGIVITQSMMKTHNSCLWLVTDHRTSGYFTLRDVIEMVRNVPEFTDIRSVLAQTTKQADRIFAHLSEFELSAKFSQHKTCLNSTLRRLRTLQEELEPDHLTRFQRYFNTHSSLTATAWTTESYAQSVTIYKPKYCEDRWQIVITQSVMSQYVDQYSIAAMADLLFQEFDVYEPFSYCAHAYGYCMSAVEDCLANMVKQLDK
jgi:hypothetical protein